MKKSIWIICGGLAAALLICLAVFANAGPKDESWYGAYVEENRDSLIRIAQGELKPEENRRISRMLARGTVEQVYTDEGRTCFYVKNKLLEGHVCLVYAPDGNVPTCLDFYDNWVQTDGPDTVRRWEGGMGGRGYIELYDLGGGFYLEEAYLPT